MSDIEEVIKRIGADGYFFESKNGTVVAILVSELAKHLAHVRAEERERCAQAGTGGSDVRTS